MFEIFIGYLLGLSLAIPPGPINAIMANESMKSPLHGTSVGAGAMTADFIFFLIVYFARLEIPSWIYPYLYMIGGIIMLFMALSVLRAKERKTNRKGNYFIGLSIGLSNPFQIFWWLTAGIFFINEFTYISLIGFFLGILTWILVFPYGMYRLTKKYAGYVKIVSFAILLIFSILMFYYAFLNFSF